MAASLAAVCVFAAFLPYGCWSHGLGKNISSPKDRPVLRTPDVFTPAQPIPLDYFGTTSMDGKLPLSEGLQTGPKNPEQAAQIEFFSCYECVKGTCVKGTEKCQTKRNTCPRVFSELPKGGQMIESYEDVCTGVECGQNFRFSFQLGVSRSKSTCHPVPCIIRAKVLQPINTADNNMLCPWCYAENQENCTSKEEKKCKGEENACVSVTSRAPDGTIEFSMQGCGTDNLCDAGCCMYPPRTVNIQCGKRPNGGGTGGGTGTGTGTGTGGSGSSSIQREHGIFLTIVAGLMPLVALWQASDQSSFLKL